MRLYRGLKQPYRPVHSALQRDPSGADFTDCPYTALQYASTRHGVVLVVEVEEDESGVRLRQELWLHRRAKRFMISGEYGRLIIGSIPAKDLRARLRQKGMGGLSDEDKSMILEWFIRDALAARRSERDTATVPDLL